MPAPVPILLMVRELNLGGSERQMVEIAKALDRSRFDPRVGCFRATGIRTADLEAAGVPIVRFPVPSILSVRGAVRIAGYVRKQGIRLVHTFDTPANIYGVPSARMAGTARVLSSQRVDRALWSPIQRHALRITDRLVDGIVVNCEFLRRHMRDDERVSAGLLHLCYNGIDTSIFYPARGPRPGALQDTPLVIGVVCALRPEKNLTALLEAFAKVKDILPGTYLAIVGSGPCSGALQRQAQDLGIMPNCVFEPATSRVPEWLNAMDIFVLPSLSEALSNSLMEAMACGCCVAASDVGGNPELVKHGETGMLFHNAEELASQLRILIPDAAMRKGLADRAECKIRMEFSLKRSAQRMGEIYAGFCTA